MGFLRTDQDYIDLGVTPPEHNPHGDTTIHPDYHLHRWVAVGNFIECDAGHHIHGQPYNHAKQIFIGTSPEGLPQFKDVELQ